MEKHEDTIAVQHRQWAEEDGLEKIQTVQTNSYDEPLEPIMTVDIDNYHGLTLKAILVALAVNLIVLSQLLNLIGAGAFARDIAEAVGGESKDTWLAQAVVIVTVVLGIPISQAADFFGRKWFIVVLTGCSVIGSIVLSRATSMGMAIAGEVVLALCYGAQPLLYAIPSETVPRKWRPAAQGALNFSSGAAGIVALLGGEAIIRDYVQGFRIYWYFIAGLLAVATVFFTLCYNPPPRPLQLTMTTREKLARLDWIGTALLICFIVPVVMGLTWAENPYSWQSAHVLAPLLVGVAAAFTLIFYEWKLKTDGLLHHELFQVDRNFGLIVFIMAVDGASFFAVNGYYAFEMGVIFETDPVRVGLRFSIVFFVAMFSSFMTAIVASRWKLLRSPIVAAFGLFVVFFALMSTVTTGSSIAVWCYPITIGLGLGMSLTCLVTLAQLSTPPALIAIASGLVLCARSFGGSIGTAIFASIFNTLLKKQLPQHIAKAVLPLGLPETSLGEFIGALAAEETQVLVKIPGVTPEIIGAGVEGLKNGYLKAFQGVWICAAALAAVAMIAACFFVKPTHISMHVDAPLERETTKEIME